MAALAARAVAARAFAVALLVVGAAPLHAQPVAYVLDPARSFVHFEVVHFGASTSRGRFGPLAGRVVLDAAAGRGEVDVRVATAAVSTGIAVFDAVLRRDDFLAVDAHPEAYFVARSVRFDGDAVAEVRGEFTLRGVGRALTLRARSFACRDDRCGGDFDGEIARSAFGITHSLPLVADRVQLRVQVEAVRAAP